MKDKNIKDIDSLKTQIEYFENNKYFYYETTDLLDQLIQLWPITKIDNNIYQSNLLDSEWISTSLINIGSNELPIFNISEYWQLILNRDTTTRVKLLYNSIVAYIQLCINNPSLLNFIDNLNVNFDLSITGNFGSYAETELFKKYFDSTNLDFLSVHESKSLEDAYTLRIFIESNDTLVNTFIVKLDEKYYTIVNLENYKFPENYNKQKNYNINNNEYLNIIGIFNTEYTRSLINDTDILELKIPGNIIIENDNIYILYNDKKIFLVQYSEFKLNLDTLNTMYKSGQFLSNFGITRYINQLSISELDLKII